MPLPPCSSPNLPQFPRLSPYKFHHLRNLLSTPYMDRTWPYSWMQRSTDDVERFNAIYFFLKRDHVFCIAFLWDFFPFAFDKMEITSRFNHKVDFSRLLITIKVYLSPHIVVLDVLSHLTINESLPYPSNQGMLCKLPA